MNILYPSGAAFSNNEKPLSTVSKVLKQNRLSAVKFVGFARYLELELRLPWDICTVYPAF